MAYVTGSVSTGQDLLNAIVTAMTDNGWTLHDTINAADKVLYSDGADGYMSMYVRVRNSYMKLNYDAEVSPFTVGQLLTGGTSGAIGTIIEVTDNGSTGVLKLVDVLGAFVDNEAITSAGGSAVVNGVPQYDGKLIDVQNPDNQFNAVYFTQYSYWNAATNTGTNERDIFGRYQYYPAAYAAATGFTEYATGPMFAHEQPGGLTLTSSELQMIRTADQYPRDATNLSLDMRSGAVRDLAIKMIQWDGYRRIVTQNYIDANNTNNLVSLDVPTRNIDVIKKLPGSIANSAYSPGMVIHRRSQNRTYRFYYNATGTTWRLVDIDTGEEIIVGTSPFTNTGISSYGARMAYDGNKYVYVSIGSTLEFKRFDLDTMTWANLTNTPIAANNTTGGYDGAFMCGAFIPANTMSGGGLWAEDRILFMITVSTTNTYAYNIGSNSWTTNPITTLPQITGGNSRLYFDGAYLHYHAVSPEAVAYRLPASSLAAGTWEPYYRNAQYQLNSSYVGGHSLLAPRASKVQYRVGSAFEYGVMADADNIVVWTAPNSLYYWAYVGNYTKTARTASAVILNSATGGAAVQLDVSNTTNFLVGDKVNILNTGTGVSVCTTVQEIGSGTITVFLQSAVSSGDAIFINKYDSIITGDTELGVCMYDDYGTYSTDHGNANALISDRYDKRAPARDKFIRLLPMYITWPFDTADKHSNKGRLTGVYSVSGINSIPNKSIIRDVDGNNYLVFLPQKRRLIGGLPIAIGPIA